MAVLAINGGKPVRDKELPNYSVMGKEEATKAYEVVKNGILSDYLGCWGDNFYGGEEVQAFEREWAKAFEVKHAITVNSNSTGLFCALGATGVGPGDEVIVTPYSMSVSASVPFFFGAIPVFADIEEDFFCLNPDDIQGKITDRTKAILIVDLFGQSYACEEVNAIAKKHNLKIIEDAAQAPWGRYGDSWTGTNGDVGVFSLNFHKHIHTGEGGVIVTNDDDLALRCQLIRNHAEAVLDELDTETDMGDMIGLNFRMTEIEAGIGRIQLKKLPGLVEKRLSHIARLEERLRKIDFLSMPAVRPKTRHAFYVHAMKYNQEKAMNVSRPNFVKAVNAELMPSGTNKTRNSYVCAGYVKPLYKLKLYQERSRLGKTNYPFGLFMQHGIDYSQVCCPVVEKMHCEQLVYHDLIHASLSDDDVADIASAFLKVAEHLRELK
jgi:dTDP-4-amino-4,6-dideoxygalactose transaminase